MSENQIAPGEKSLQRGKLLWQQSQVDLKSAWKKWKGGQFLESSCLSLQASINALSAVCTLNGIFQYPNFSPMRMSALCVEKDPRFERLQEACMALEEVQEADPFSDVSTPIAGKEGSRACYDHGEAVITLVKGYLKDNRGRFFSP